MKWQYNKLIITKLEIILLLCSKNENIKWQITCDSAWNTKWLDGQMIKYGHKKELKDRLNKRSVTSGYHGGKISGSQQSFFDRDGHLDCRMKEESMGYWFLPECKFMHRKVIHVILFCCICRTMVCWDPKVLLPWQHDITTSLIHLIHDTQHLCTCSRTDGIKALSRSFSGGKQVKKFGIGRNQGWVCLLKRPFHLKYDNVKIWVEGL